MRILHTVEFYYPSKGGSQAVVQQLSERMAAMGHEVVVATSWLPERKSRSLNGVTIKEFKIAGNKVRGYQGDTEAYQEFLLSEKFDVIMNYAAQQWATDLCFDVIDQIKTRKILVPCGFSGLKDPAYIQYFKQMPEWLKKYDKTIYLSDTYQDAVFAKQHKIKNMVIIPNGADEREFESIYNGDIRQELSIGPNKVIMHLGSFTGAKGQPEAIEIYKRAAIPNSRLILVGNVFDPKTYNRSRLAAFLFNIHPLSIKKNMRIRVLQLPRDKTVALLQAADVFLFPSNIEASPLVLFEACAAKTPFLTSDVGNAKEIIEWTGGGVCLPTLRKSEGYTLVDTKKSASDLVKLIDDQAMINSMASQGFAAWKSRYTWAVIVEQYLEVYCA
jgi:glycosyltransferase involved in cell wall biosynthesis